MVSTAPSSGRSAWRGTGPGGPLRSQSAERVLPGEDALVPEAARQGPAGAAALAALVGLLPGVDPLVLNEAGALAEGLTALLTRKGLLAVVEPQVLREVRALHEGLPAVAARVGLLASVDLLVLHQVRLAALGRLFPAWRLPLLQDVGPSRGGLGAHGPVQCCFARRGSPRLLGSEWLLQLGRSYPGSLLRGLPGGSPGWRSWFLSSSGLAWCTQALCGSPARPCEPRWLLHGPAGPWTCGPDLRTFVPGTPCGSAPESAPHSELRPHGLKPEREAANDTRL